MQAEIGVFGGSGFYQFLENTQEVKVTTPYGLPSGPVMMGTLGEKTVAFIPRHGQQHTLPPHQVPYRANLAAFKELGVTRVISPCASGSLQASVKPGDFVLCDQFVDRTRGRVDSYFDEGNPVTHVDMSEPYCPALRKIAIDASQPLPFTVHPTGTVVVIQGPRFSSRAESQWFTQAGFHVINMTQYPEVVLARELGLCFVNISLITDYDVGLRDLRAPVTAADIFNMIKENNEKLRTYLFSLIVGIPKKRTCACSHALDEAQIK